MVNIMNDSNQTHEYRLPAETNSNNQSKRKLGRVVLILTFIAILASLVYGIIALVKAGPDIISQVRDIFIIILAIESFIIGIALIILVFQLAALSNTLQNEIKPILNDTKKTINTVKGTTSFLSQRAVKPVITLNSYLAGAKKLFEMLGSFKK